MYIFASFELYVSLSVCVYVCACVCMVVPDNIAPSFFYCSGKEIAVGLRSVLSIMPK